MNFLAVGEFQGSSSEFGGDPQESMKFCEIQDTFWEIPWLGENLRSSGQYKGKSVKLWRNLQRRGKFDEVRGKFGESLGEFGGFKKIRGNVRGSSGKFGGFWDF